MLEMLFMEPWAIFTIEVASDTFLAAAPKDTLVARSLLAIARPAASSAALLILKPVDSLLRDLLNILSALNKPA